MSILSIRTAQRFYIRLGLHPLDRGFVLNSNSILVDLNVLLSLAHSKCLSRALRRWFSPAGKSLRGKWRWFPGLFYVESSRLRQSFVFTACMIILSFRTWSFPVAPKRSSAWVTPQLREPLDAITTRAQRKKLVIYTMRLSKTLY